MLPEKRSRKIVWNLLTVTRICQWDNRSSTAVSCNCKRFLVRPCKHAGFISKRYEDLDAHDRAQSIREMALCAKGGPEVIMLQISPGNDLANFHPDNLASFTMTCAAFSPYHGTVRLVTGTVPLFICYS
jgi:hypothetical protein